MDVVALEPYCRYHQGTVAVQLAVDVATTVLAIPILLLFQHVVQEGVGTERLLLAHEALDIVARRVDERGEIEHGQIAELRIAATVIEDRLRCRSVEHGDLRCLRSFRRGICCLVLNLRVNGDVFALLFIRSCHLGHGLNFRFRFPSSLGHALDALHTGERALDLFTETRLHLGRMFFGRACASLTTIVSTSATTIAVIEVCHELPSSSKFRYWLQPVTKMLLEMLEALALLIQAFFLLGLHLLACLGRRHEHTGNAEAHKCDQATDDQLDDRQECIVARVHERLERPIDAEPHDRATHGTGHCRGKALGLHLRARDEVSHERHERHGHHPAEETARQNK